MERIIKRDNQNLLNNQMAHSSRQIASFFNDNYNTKFKDLDFAKPTPTTARRVFNVLMNETMQVKNRERNRMLEGACPISLPKLIYITELTKLMKDLGYEDFDIVNDIAFVEKQRFLKMCESVIKYLELHKKYDEKKEEIINEFKSQRNEVSELEDIYKKGVKEKEELIKREENDKPEVDRIKELIKKEEHKRDLIIKNTENINEEILSILEQITTTESNINKLQNDIQNGNDYNHWAKNVFNLLTIIQKCELDIVNQKDQIKRLDDEINVNENQITRFNALKQSCVVWRSNVQIVNEGLMKIKELQDDLERNLLEKEDKTHQLQTKQKNCDETKSSLKKDTEEMEKREIIRKQLSEKADELCLQFERDSSQLRQIHEDVTKKVENAQISKKGMIEIINEIDKRVKNIKTTHFYMVREFHDQLIQLKSILSALNILQN